MRTSTNYEVRSTKGGLAGFSKFCFVFGFILILLSSCSENKTPAEKNLPSQQAVSYKDTVDLISENIAAIDSLPFTDSVVLDAEEYLDHVPDGGAELKGYFRKNELLKVSDWTGFSYGIQRRAFYFRNDELSFVHEEEDDFYADSNGTNLHRFEQHYQADWYFSSKKLIRRTTAGTQRFADSINSETSSLLTDAYEWQKIILAKKRGR